MARLPRHLILVLSLSAVVFAATAGPAAAHRAKVVVRPRAAMVVAAPVSDHRALVVELDIAGS